METFSVAVDITAGGIRTFARWCGLPLGMRVVDRARPTGGRLRLAVALGAAITLAAVTVHP